ncbi:thioredoxin domain-containing protein [Sulfurospirillum sp. 1612]|uniref:thioredoxin domain-containing protein n=1 Tax=Sulfurospirillum sp. 1612 TaxID=3094835 RepID=UPI002F946B24
MNNHLYINDLIHEDSPYLRQHAHNPVQWMAWNDTAFSKAKEENKLIFLSIGYSTCHWCHVMERETFEDEKAASLLNDAYVSIKVDREEMPDIDKYYQEVFYLLNKRSGGWPLSIIMTPNREVIFAATYLPPVDSANMSSFSHIISFIAKKFKEAPQEVQKSASSISAALERYQSAQAQQGSLDIDLLEAFISGVKNSFDDLHKGIGQAPKFPHASTFDTLIDLYKSQKNQEALFMAQDALDAMAQGGINDQIEGGFYRYSTDEAWMIPHFEKMLYTNAEMITAYANLYSIKPNASTKKVIDETIANMNERFLEKGLYKSASDADSEGEEGKYFVFEYISAKQALEEAGFDEMATQRLLSYLNITKYGNFENNTSNPYIEEGEVPENLAKAKSVLKQLRSHVSYPFIDDKILTSWNALMASALFDAGVVDEKYSKEGVLLVENILKYLSKEGVLYHQLLLGSSLKVVGLLEDYAFLIDALIKAHQYTQNTKYLQKAADLTQLAIEKFYHEHTWYLSDGDFKAKASLDDSSYKSASAKMIQNIFVISLLGSHAEQSLLASEMLSFLASTIKQYPSAYPEAIKALMMDQVGVIVLKGPKEALSTLYDIKKEMAYPYIYVLENKEKALQACSSKACFSHSNVADEIKKDILKYLKQE